MYMLVAGIITVITIWFLQGQRSAIRRHGKPLPRPPGTLPFAGNGIWFLQPRYKLLDWFSQSERRTGFSTYEVSVPSLPPGIVINDPKNIEHVLKNNDIFIKGDFFRLRSWDLFGNGIINADGDLWRIQRKAGLRFFSNSNLKIFIDHVLPPLLKETKSNLDQAAMSRKQVDLQAILLELTTHLMGNVAYDSLEIDLPATLPFSKAFDFASGAIGNRFQNPFWKMKEFVWGAPLRKAVHEVKKFGDAIVSTAVNKRVQANAKPTDGPHNGITPLQNNLINSLLDHIEDRRVVADAAMNYLSAGRDTTAQSLTWTFYLLMRHPKVQKKVLAELGQVFPNAEREIHLSFDNVQPTSLPYTTAVFNETIRLYPPVPVELKECTADNTFPDGTWLPKGTVVMWAPWSMGRSTLIWGDDADEFRPDRWLAYDREDQAPSLMTKTAFEFPVFNGGPRSCLGKKMAELLAVYVIASLVWTHEFQEVCEQAPTADGPKARLSQNSLTLPMAGGLPCHVARRLREKT
ncbi:MAG: hypothetical protein Q9217_000672 [Psora testacea]